LSRFEFARFRVRVQTHGFSLFLLQSNLKRVLAKEAKQHPTPTDPPHSSFLNRALNHAESLRAAAQDSHIAVDQLLLGLLHEAEREVLLGLPGIMGGHLIIVCV
jgi:ATP-dependent Clp protease ATP-binding subunit ClpA